MYVLTDNRGLYAARKIAHALGEQLIRFKVGKWVGVLTEPRPTIRWGALKEFPLATKECNSLWAIKNANNKPAARFAMSRAGIPVPKTTLSPPDYPHIARPSYHCLGRDFHIVTDGSRVEGEGFYYSEIIDKKKEFRVHVGSGKVLCSYEKFLKEGEIRSNQAVTGMGWSGMITAPEDACRAAIDACRVLGLDTGAVDVLYTDTPYVCEVNVIPDIKTDQLLQVYADYFREWAVN